MFLGPNLPKSSNDIFGKIKDKSIKDNAENAVFPSNILKPDPHVV